MMNLHALVLGFLVNLKLYADPSFEEMKDLDENIAGPFSLLKGAVVLLNGTLENIRNQGPYALDAQDPLHKKFLHRAFTITAQNDPYAFSKRFEYPCDAISALIQWLFPSVDGTLFVANTRDADPVGFFGQTLKSNPEPFAKLLMLINNYQHQYPHTDKRKDKIKKQFQKDILEIIPNTQGEKRIEPYINGFSNILYQALEMDGTFGGEYYVLYPKNIAVNALLGYMWRICDTKSQALLVMEKAGFLKKPHAFQHRFESAILAQAKYTKADYEAIKIKQNPTFEELAFAGYGYEVYENPNPEMIVYSNADITPSKEDLRAYPYLKSHRFHPDCGETGLRNLINLAAFAGTGRFDADLLPNFNTPYMKKIKKFYQDFSTISLQKQSPANTAWSTIVSNLNGTPSSSDDPMDVRYDGYSNIKASLGMKNILNVMAKLTGDDVLNQVWKTGDEEKTHIAQKLTRLCKILSRGEDFTITWEIGRQKETAPVHGDFEFIVTRKHQVYVFDFKATSGHFALISSNKNPNDWRKNKLEINQDESLKFFAHPYNPLTYTTSGDLNTILTLRSLYKQFGSVVNDPNAQINIMRKINLIDKNDEMIQKWGKALLVDKLQEIAPHDALMFEYEFSQTQEPALGFDLWHYAIKTGLIRTVYFLMDQASQEDKNQALLTAVANRHKRMTEMLLHYGADHSIEDHQTRCPLMIACEKGFFEIAEAILRYEPDVNQSNEWGETPLIKATENGFTDIVLLLLHNKANINITNPQNETPLIIATERGHLGLVEIFLNEGADKNQKDPSGATPLIIAAEIEHEELIDFLLGQNVKINEKNKHGMTAIMYAAKKGHLGIFNKLLDKGADLKLKDNFGMSALNHAYSKSLNPSTEENKLKISKTIKEKLQNSI